MIKLILLSTPLELLHQVKDSTSQTIFVQPNLFPVLKEALKLDPSCNIPESKIFLLCPKDKKPADLKHLKCTEDLWDMGKGIDGRAQWEEDVGNKTAYLCYSSGTTGKAKGVETSHHNMTSQVSETRSQLEQVLTDNCIDPSSSMLIRTNDGERCRCRHPALESHLRKLPPITGQTIPTDYRSIGFNYVSNLPQTSSTRAMLIWHRNLHHALSTNGTVVILPKFEEKTVLEVIQRVCPIESKLSIPSLTFQSVQSNFQSYRPAYDDCPSSFFPRLQLRYLLTQGLPIWCCSSLSRLDQSV